MKQTISRLNVADLDGLRLVALGRISRCQECPRYLALVESHFGPERDVESWPTVPANCSFEVCAPLVARFTPPAVAAEGHRLLRVVAGSAERQRDWASR